MQNPYMTTIIDVRPEGHQSLSVIPRFMSGDYDRLRSHWKFDMLFDYGHDLAEVGQLFWGISAIEVKSGPAILQPQVRDQDNDLIAYGILMMNNWLTAPDLHSDIFPRYFNNAVAGFTNSGGTIGWPFAGESWINAAEPNSHDGGPYSVWASAHPEDFQPAPERVVGSDCMTKIGWWDDHIILNPMFSIMKKPGAVDPPTGKYELLTYDQDGNYVGRVLLTDGAATSGRIALVNDNVEISHVPMTI